MSGHTKKLSLRTFGAGLLSLCCTFTTWNNIYGLQMTGAPAAFIVELHFRFW